MYKQCTAPWVANALEDEFRTHPSYRPEDIQAEIMSRHGVHISYWTAWSARVKILENINGNYEEGYRLLPELCRQIQNKNPGTIARWSCTKNTREFVGVCIAFKASIDGWLEGCRPILGLDGSFLKGKYGGCYLSVIGLDVMNGLFPIGIYICQGENKANWQMLLKLLKPDFDQHREKLTFISDRQKGLIPVVHAYFPDSNHRFCFRHMFKIFKKVFKGDMWEKLAWDAARKYRMASFTEKMGDIVKTDQKATDWLDSEERSCWARAYFDHTCKCDEITNNFSESCNSWILKMRDKPLVQFVDMYNLSLVKLMYDRMMVSRELGDYDVVVPTVLHIIKKREAKYKNYKVSGVSDHISLVQNTKNKKHYCVDLEKKTCECIVWQMSGVPCVQTICVIRQRRDKWSKYCSEYLTVEAFKSTYFTHIHPIANQEDWEIIIDLEDLVNPPEFKPQVGRPKKQRIRDEDEPEATSKVLRKCGKCGELNHNTRTCDAMKNITRPKKRAKKSIIQDKLQGNFQQQQKAAPASVQQQVPPQQQQAPPNVQQQAPQQQQRVTRSTRRAPQQQQAPPQQQQAPQQQQRATRSTRRDWLSWFEASGASNQESSTPPPSLRQT